MAEHAPMAWSGSFPPHRFQLSSRVWPRRTADPPIKVIRTTIDRKRTDWRETTIYYFGVYHSLVRYQTSMVLMNA